MQPTQALSFAIRCRTVSTSSSTSSSHPPRQRPTSTSSTFVTVTSRRPRHVPMNPRTTFIRSCRLSPQSHRSFTHHPSLLAIYRQHLARPQLPFLYPSSIVRSTNRSFLTRYLSTERKRRWRQTLRWQLRFHAYLWPTLVLVSLILTGIRQAELEKMYPTPRTWGFWPRWWLRCGLFEEDRCGHIGGGVLRERWVKVARYYAGVVERCDEELKKKRETSGKDREEQAAAAEDHELQEGVLVDGLGLIGGGADIDNMDEQWRCGYYQALLGCARCAENLEDMAKKKGEEYGRLVPWDSVVGPSNPRPKPLPWDKKGRYKTPPAEDEVEDAFPKPEKYYMKILTTKGFSHRQRLDAAIAYADYLDYKGLHNTAGDMYDWALDIAAGGLLINANNVVDMKTGILNTGKDKFVSENLLKASTAIGVHFARMGDVQSALPVFLSVLRARRNLDPTPAEAQTQLARAKTRDRKQMGGGFWGSLLALKDFIVERPYPQIPTSGNQRPYHSLGQACEEVGLMTYIGEILFASSEKEREKGLRWTRDSVDAAEAILWVMDEKGDFDGAERCRECLGTGLENWKTMTREMTRLARDQAEAAASYKGWFSTGFGKGSTIQKARDNINRWEEEDSQIELRQLKTASLIHPVKSPGSTFYSA